MSVILSQLRPGNRFCFHPEGMKYVYVGAGWCYADVPGTLRPRLHVEVEQVVFLVGGD